MRAKSGVPQLCVRILRVPERLPGAEDDRLSTAIAMAERLKLVFEIDMQLHAVISHNGPQNLKKSR